MTIASSLHLAVSIPDTSCKLWIIVSIPFSAAHTSGMDNPCECCQNKMKFIRQINGNFKHSMVISEWFVNHFSGKISGTMKLEAPNGIIYEVGVTKNMNRTVLQSGWEAFVDANQIEENYSLMFRYLGISRFEVTIFDFNGKEKVPCCAGMRSASNVQKPSKYYSDISSSSHDGTIQLSASEGSDLDESQKRTSLHYRKSAKMPAASYSSEELSAEDNPSVDESVDSDDLPMLSNYYVLSGLCDLTEAQEAQVHALVRKIQPKIPLLVVQMKKTNVRPRNDLVIRKDYALTYFPHKNQNITLQLPKKSKDWECRFHIRSDRGDCHLCLLKFLHDNRVREGDICLLQPITEVNARRFTVAVHLLPKETIDRAPGGKTDIGSNHGLKSAKMASTACVKEELATDGMAARHKEDKSEEISSENGEHGFSDSFEGASEPPFMMPIRTCLTRAQENKVLKKLEEINSELPIYVAIMTKSNVCSRRNYPTLDFGLKYATRYIGRECATGRHGKKDRMSLELRREGKGATWPTELQHTINLSRIVRGWPCFARANRLRERDICLFKLMEKTEEQLKMMVYIIRREK